MSDILKTSKYESSTLCEQFAPVLHQFCSKICFLCCSLGSLCFVLLLCIPKNNFFASPPHRQSRLQVAHSLFLTQLQKVTSISLCWCNLCSCPLWQCYLLCCLWVACLSLVMSVPRLDAILQIQMQSHMCQVEGNNHFPLLSDCAV